jgi:hypothetical protein
MTFLFSNETQTFILLIIVVVLAAGLIVFIVPGCARRCGRSTCLLSRSGIQLTLQTDSDARVSPELTGPHVAAMDEPTVVTVETRHEPPTPRVARSDSQSSTESSSSHRHTTPPPRHLSPQASLAGHSHPQITRGHSPLAPVASFTSKHQRSKSGVW